MHHLQRPWGHMHYQRLGAQDAPVIVWANSLGTDLRMWDQVVDLMPAWQHLRFDKRGHGLSATPDQPWDVTDLADDIAALMDHLAIDRAIIAGCSVGGMIAQAFGLRHPNRARALILSNTAAKIGTPEAWRARIDGVQSGGMAAIADVVIERWFAPKFMAQPWKTMPLRCDPMGYMGTCAALSRADFRADLGHLSLPCLMIAGGKDQATPPELVADTCALIPSAKLVEITNAGHLPAIDAAQITANMIESFLQEQPYV